MSSVVGHICKSLIVGLITLILLQLEDINVYFFWHRITIKNKHCNYWLNWPKRTSGTQYMKIPDIEDMD